MDIPGASEVPGIVGASGEARISCWDAARLASLTREQQIIMRDLIDTMGALSSRAQNLPKVITDFARVWSMPQRLYLVAAPAGAIPGARGKKGVSILGLLKVGPKKLFIRTRGQDLKEIDPLCVLDFYVHESQQRLGLGHYLFEHFLQQENVHPASLGYDKPSPKLIGFMAKHYGLKDFVPQMNHFVVYNKYWEVAGEARGSKGNKLQRKVLEEAAASSHRSTPNNTQSNGFARPSPKGSPALTRASSWSSSRPAQRDGDAPAGQPNVDYRQRPPVQDDEPSPRENYANDVASPHNNAYPQDGYDDGNNNPYAQYPQHARDNPPAASSSNGAYEGEYNAHEYNTHAEPMHSTQQQGRGQPYTRADSSQQQMRPGPGPTSNYSYPQQNGPNSHEPVHDKRTSNLKAANHNPNWDAQSRADSARGSNWDAQSNYSHAPMGPQSYEPILEKRSKQNAQAANWDVQSSGGGSTSSSAVPPRFGRRAQLGAPEHARAARGDPSDILQSRASYRPYNTEPQFAAAPMRPTINTNQRAGDGPGRQLPSPGALSRDMAAVKLDHLSNVLSPQQMHAMRSQIADRQPVNGDNGATNHSGIRKGSAQPAAFTRPGSHMHTPNATFRTSNSAPTDALRHRRY
eukprot:jgi/Chlat1/8274/Chrsp78S07696